VGGLAGCAAFVFVIGGCIEAIRLNHAGLPVSQAMPVVARETLFSLAVNALLLPVAITAGVVVLLLFQLHRWVERRTTPEATQQRLEAALLSRIAEAVAASAAGELQTAQQQLAEVSIPEMRQDAIAQVATALADRFAPSFDDYLKQHLNEASLTPEFRERVHEVIVATVRRLMTPPTESPQWKKALRSVFHSIGAPFRLILACCPASPCRMAAGLLA
jgi:membrane protein implicated in regulation of membrane protease activity